MPHRRVRADARSVYPRAVWLGEPVWSVRTKHPGRTVLFRSQPVGRYNVEVGRRRSKSWHLGTAMREFITVDPGELYLPPSRSQGADPGKLAQQIARYGNSLDGMPVLQVVRGQGGHLRINDGVTRATRAAKLRPGEMVVAEVIDDLPKLNVTRTPRVKDVLP